VSRTHLLRRAAIACAATLGVLASTVTAGPASAADNPHQRGPNPTQASVAASRGTFATAETSVGGGNGFGGAKIYYPTDTSQGKFAALAVSPGYTATWAAEGAWMGHWLASFGFVIIGIDTISRTDWDVARGDQLLAALDYLTQRSSVRTRIDASRLAVSGHSMGGGGSLEAASDRPSLQAAVPLAPWNADKSWTELRVPTLIIGGESDSIASVSSHSIPFYNSIPASAEKSYLELNNASHYFPQSTNTPTAVQAVAWLKRFVDNDTRYDQFICPGPSSSSISDYRSTCPLS
jgi:pimeloyl-ACP methyl ester carboxylesterase